MAADVKNIAGGDTGSANNGRVVVYGGARAASLFNKVSKFDGDGFSNFSIADFDNAPPGTDISARYRRPRYYSGDAVT